VFRPVPRGEVYRKLLHVLVVFLPIGIFYGPEYFSTTRSFVAFFALGILIMSLVLEYSRFRFPGFGNWWWSFHSALLRDREKYQLTGATYMAGGSFLCACISVISESFAAYAFLSFALFILGDAAAALVGKSFGRTRVGMKTLEGALGCFLLSFSLAYWIFPYFPKFSETLGGPLSLVQSVVVALSISLLELFPVKLKKFSLNDNLYVPVVATWIVSIAHSIL